MFYCSPLLMEVNVALRFVLSDGITAIRARPVAEAMRAYSIAVAPDSFLRKHANITLSFVLIDTALGITTKKGWLIHASN